MLMRLFFIRRFVSERKQISLMADEKSMKKAILIVSFGTTYPETRQKNIAAITRQVRALYPDVLVAEAVSSTIVRNVMKKREHMDAKSPEEGLIKLKEQGATHVAVFPTHVIDGIENHRMKQAVEEYRLAFEQITVADALLTEPEDYTNVANRRCATDFNGTWHGTRGRQQLRRYGAGIAGIRTTSGVYCNR